MKKKIIRNLALHMAIFQLFSSSAIAQDNIPTQTEIIESHDSITPKSNKDKFILIKDNDNSPTFYMIDTNTGEYNPISIFNYDNTFSHQYGANQGVFKNNFDSLIQDPIIWNEMQKYYPVEKFDYEEEAMYFYQKYFNIICDCGCGYAAATNYIFRLFEGREEDFYKAFGYPMYLIKNNNVDFNYEILMLELFNYYNLKINKSYHEIELSMEKDFLLFKLKTYKEKTAIKKLDRKETNNWTQEQWDEWYAKGRVRENHIAELNEKIKKANNKEINLGIPLDNKFGNLKGFLKEHGININVSLTNGLKNIMPDEIIASDNYDLYQINGYGYSKRNDVGLHYVYITEINKENGIIVSSWGDMYVYDDNKANWTQKVKVK